MDYKSYIGLITIALAFLSYGLYFRNIFRHKTKPHAVSWLVWAILNGVTFLTQRSNGAGAGGWITGFSACVALVIFVLSINYGEKNITKLDWYCVVGALISLSFWYLNDHSVDEVLFASTTFVIGFVPTFRKSFGKPRQETAVTFGLNGFKFLLALAALNKLNASTVIYPVTVVVMNFSFVIFLLIRRGRIAR